MVTITVSQSQSLLHVLASPLHINYTGGGELNPMEFFPLAEMSDEDDVGVDVGVGARDITAQVCAHCSRSLT